MVLLLIRLYNQNNCASMTNNPTHEVYSILRAMFIGNKCLKKRIHFH